MKTISTLIIMFVTMPIWAYLWYKVLVAVNASELMWFLFYAYIPFVVFAQILSLLATGQIENKKQ